MIEKGYTFGIICGVIALLLSAMVQELYLMALALLAISINVILLVRYKGSQ